jgi:hypothetical protein
MATKTEKGLANCIITTDAYGLAFSGSGLTGLLPKY